MPKINDYLQGFQDNLPGMKDFRHASRLYVDDTYKLMPKQKFLFHVVFQLNNGLHLDKFSNQELYELNMLVKRCDLPRYGLNIEEKIQYNKKMYAATRIQYDPINITFHDDHADTVNAFWKKYYEYHIADSVGITSESMINQMKDDYYDPIGTRKINKYGMDVPIKKKEPFLKQIDIFVLHKQRFTSMSLINPIIGSFNHDSVDQADGTGIMENVMQIFYETVVYGSGVVNKQDVPGFATVRYDNEPSPLTILGGGTNSIFGPGGVIDGVGSVIRNVRSGNILGAILSASNTYRNAKKIKKKNVKQELKGLAKKGIQEVAKSAGTISNPIAQFGIGAAIAAGTIASARGTSDNKTGQNNTTITTAKFDATKTLTPDESYNMVLTNETLKDEIAAGIYYKDIGSRKNLTVAESDLEYSNATATTKTVYRNKVITDIRKLVNEGYVKIARENQDVAIVTEKANI